MTNINKQLASNLHNLAQQAFEQNKHDAAHSLWTAAIAQDPENVDLYVSLAGLESAKGNDSAVKELLTQAVRLDPNNFQAALGLAGAINRQQRPSAGAATARPAVDAEVLKACEQAASAFAPTARAEASAGQPEAAAQAAPESPKTPSPAASQEAPTAPSSSEPEAVPAHHSTPYGDDDELRARRHFDRGKQHLDRNNHSAAIRAFREAIAVDGSNPKYFYKLASVYHMQQKNPAEAQALYEKARDFDPANPMWHNGLGVCLEDLGRLSQALHSVEHALFLRPDNKLYQENTARVKGKLEAARRSEAAPEAPQTSRPETREPTRSRDNTGASPSDPLASRASDNANVAERRRQLTTAYNRLATRLDAKLAAQPRDPALAMEAARLHYLMGRFDKAAALFARVRTLAPPTPESLRFTVDALKVNSAENNFAHAVKMARYLDVEDALPYFMAAAEQAPSHALYKSFVGLCFLSMGMAEDATMFFRKAHDEAAPADRRAAVFNLVTALEAAGRSGEASHYRGQAGLDPDVQVAAQSLLAVRLGKEDNARVGAQPGVPGDGLVEGQQIESLENIVLGMTTQHAEHPQSSYREAPRQEAPRREAPRRETPRAQPSAQGTGAAQPDPARPGSYYRNLPEHLQAGPSYTAARLGRVSATQPKMIAFNLDNKMVEEDLSAYGLSPSHLNSIRLWLQAESTRKNTMTQDKLLKQAIPMWITVGNIGYRYVRREIEQQRMLAMIEGLNSEYAHSNLRFEYKRGHLINFRRRVPKIKVYADAAR